MTVVVGGDPVHLAVPPPPRLMVIVPVGPWSTPPLPETGLEQEKEKASRRDKRRGKRDKRDKRGDK